MLATYGKQYKGYCSGYGEYGHKSTDKICPAYKEDNKDEKEKKKTNNNDNKKRFLRKCYNYGKSGHRSYKCKKGTKELEKLENNESTKNALGEKRG